MIGGDTTPEVFCSQLMEMADQIENIVVVVKFKNDEHGLGETEVFNTVMTNGDKAWLRWVFDQDFRP